MSQDFNLFLDDERTPDWLLHTSNHQHIRGNSTIMPQPKDWIVARDIEEAKELIALHGYPSIISLDHDLGEGNEPGIKFVDWLIEEDLDNDWMTPGFIYFIHSMNPVGNRQMYLTLKNYLRRKHGKY